MNSNGKPRQLQRVERQEDSQPLPLGHKNPIRISNVRDAKRLLARLIREFQKGRIEDRWAKTLTYIVTSYVSVAKDTEIEERLQRLEEHLAEKRKV